MGEWEIEGRLCSFFTNFTVEPSTKHSTAHYTYCNIGTGTRINTVGNYANNSTICTET